MKMIKIQIYPINILMKQLLSQKMRTKTNPLQLKDIIEFLKIESRKRGRDSAKNKNIKPFLRSIICIANVKEN